MTTRPTDRTPQGPARRRRAARTALAVAATAGLLLTAACGSEDSSAYGDDAAAGDEEPAAADGYDYGDDYGDDGSGASAQLGSPAGELLVAKDTTLGEIVTDGEGFTLYRFELDTADPPASTCDADCAGAWPPVPADDATASDGVDATLLGEVERGDGSRQLTLAGWPVYRYAEDTAPGDLKGHGVGGTWNALAPDGSPAGQQERQEQQDQQEEAEEAEELPALSVTEDAELGPIVRDGAGRTLYRFDKDSAWPMETHCTGACLDAWKPAAPVDPAEVEGIDPALVNTFQRPDGTQQLAIDCWILYWYTGDENPGDTAGHGAQGLWWAVRANGTKAAAQ